MTSAARGRACHRECMLLHPPLENLDNWDASALLLTIGTRIASFSFSLLNCVDQRFVGIHGRAVHQRGDQICRCSPVGPSDRG
jgi:hypothetical protein